MLDPEPFRRVCGRDLADVSFPKTAVKPRNLTPSHASEAAFSNSRNKGSLSSHQERLKTVERKPQGREQMTQGE